MQIVLILITLILLPSRVKKQHFIRQDWHIWKTMMLDFVTTFKGLSKCKIRVLCKLLSSLVSVSLVVFNKYRQQFHFPNLLNHSVTQTMKSGYIAINESTSSHKFSQEVLFIGECSTSTLE